MAGGVIVAVEIVILTQTRTFLCSFCSLGEQGGVDDGDGVAHRIFLRMIHTINRDFGAHRSGDVC
jgi:hypothetical protein